MKASDRRGEAVLLVNTNRIKPAVAPIGLDYLADSLRAAGHEPVLLDLCFSQDIERDIAAVLETEPAVVGLTVRNTDDCYLAAEGGFPLAAEGGFSCATSAFFLPGIREIVQTIRAHSDAPVVLGGVGFSLMPEAVVQYCGADFGVAGEGEEAFVDLVSALRAGSDFGGVPGLLWREKTFLRRNPPREAPLERLPVRTRSLVDNARYFREGGQAGFETKRGCPMSCMYCADPVAKGRRSRLLPPRMVVSEIQALLSQGIDHLHACDCELNLPVEHARDVCAAIIDAGLAGRIRWYAYCSVEPFNRETAELMRDAGCAGIDFGADSGQEEMLRRLGRHYGPQALLDAAAACRQAGIPFMYDLLLGGPGETPETVRQSLELVRKAGPDRIGLSLGVRIYEGTALAEQVRAAGPLSANPALRGARLDNDSLLKPVFYLSPALGADPAGLVRELVGNDERVFLPGGPDEERDYNYADNERLVRALARGERGAYWDILRRIAGT